MNADQQFLSARIDNLTKMGDLQSFCKYAIDTLDTLLINNEQECDTLEYELSRQKHELETAAVEHTRATDQLATESHEKANWEAKLRGQESMIRSLEAENAEKDVTPIHGWINAIISGDGSRAIPFYSQIDGIISEVEQDLEASVDRLNRSLRDVARLRDQARETERQIYESHETIAMLQERVNRAQETIDDCDRKTKAIGQELTRLHNIRVQLKLLRDKLQHMRREIEIESEMGETFLIGECLDDFRRLLVAP